MSDSWKIAAFYHFTDLPDHHAWAERMVEHGLKVGLRGTLIFAPEGVNSTCAGSPEAIDATIALLQSDARFEGMSVKYSCLLYTSPSPRDGLLSRMPSSA